MTRTSPPKRWLVTGVAGFIGSHVLEELLRRDQEVVGLDDFSTGHAGNLREIEKSVTPAQWRRFQMIKGDIREVSACRDACSGVDVVLHQAALGSVPSSIRDPLTWNAVNVSGFLNLMIAARDAGVRRVVYASSSAVYGDDQQLPKVEDRTGRPMSPYAASKAADELYATAFAACYGMQAIGLRYFNVYGPRQDPEGPYAAVIPQWILALLKGRPVTIYGDGETTRDFCYVADVVSANLLAASSESHGAGNQACNIGFGSCTTLNELYDTLARIGKDGGFVAQPPSCKREDFREGDVRHSQADISRAREALGYAPTWGLQKGLEKTFAWFAKAASRT